MTDNEIIRKLESCVKGTYNPGARAELLENTIDLIKRQNTEIDILIRKKEALRDEIAELQTEGERLRKALK